MHVVSFFFFRCYSLLVLSNIVIRVKYLFFGFYKFTFFLNKGTRKGVAKVGLKSQTGMEWIMKKDNAALI